MSLQTLDWYITKAIELKMYEKDVYGNTAKAVDEIVARVKQNMVDAAMVCISKEYMQEIVDKHTDWDNL